MALATLALGCVSYLQLTRADAMQETGPDPFDLPIAEHVDFRANHQIGHGSARFAWYDADYAATHNDGKPAIGERPHAPAPTDPVEPPGAPNAHDSGDHTPAGAGGGSFGGGNGGGNLVANLPRGGDGAGAGEAAGWGPGGGFYAPPASGGGGGHPAGNAPAANTPANTGGVGPGNNPPHDSAPTDTGSAGSNQPKSDEPPPSNHNDDTLHTGSTHDGDDHHHDGTNNGGDDQHHGEGGTPNPPYSIDDPLPTDTTGDPTWPSDPPPNEVHSVPEPGTLGLLAVSLASAAALRRRRRKTTT